MAAQPVVYFPRDRQALDVYMELPKARKSSLVIVSQMSTEGRTVHLDEDRTAILCVATGRNQLVKVSLKLSCGNGETSFDMTAATVLEGSEYIIFCARTGTDETCSCDNWTRVGGRIPTPRGRPCFVHH